MATTGRGWPYPIPSDPINAYPTMGQELANKLDALDGAVAGKAPAAHRHPTSDVDNLGPALASRLATTVGTTTQQHYQAFQALVTFNGDGNGRLTYPSAMTAVQSIVVTPQHTNEMVGGTPWWALIATVNVFTTYADLRAVHLVMGNAEPYRNGVIRVHAFLVGT